MPTNDKVDWEQAKRCLAEIDQSSRGFLYRALLIGGVATWFYRHQLVKAADPDFNVQTSNPTDENAWLSHDMDFTGIIAEEAFSLLPGNLARDEKGRTYIEVKGVRLGFAQVGLSFDPEEAFLYANIGSVTVEDRTVEFLVLDPLTLYYEKCMLCGKRGTPNDRQHKALLYEYVAYELVRGAERVLPLKAPVPEAREILIFWKRVAAKACEFMQDQRILKRLKPLLARYSKHEIAQYFAAD